MSMLGTPVYNLPAPTPESREWTIDIVADNEVRFRTSSKVVTQKRIVLNPKNPQREYDEFWTREIAAFLSDKAYLHQKFPEAMYDLQWVLWHPKTVPKHQDVAQALLNLLGEWMRACSDDITCIPPPSTAMIEDKEWQKLYNWMQKQKVPLNITQE